MNWAAIRGPRGSVYFGNSYGLMAYDGGQWDLVLEPTNRTHIVSLAIDFNRRIYIGAEGDMGYLTRNAMGQMGYQSINPLIPEAHKDYGLVWNIIVFGKDIYYFTDYNIYMFNGSGIKVLSFDKQIIFSQKVSGEILIQQRNGGLQRLKEDGSLASIANTEFLEASEVKYISSRPSGLVVVSDQNGIWMLNDDGVVVWNRTLSQFIKDKKINMSVDLSSGMMAIGTVKDGLIIVGTEGEIILHLNKDNGLRNNAVMDILEDERNNLWLALGNGISYVESGSNFYYLDDRSNLNGSVYSSVIKDDYLYVATNQGVYRKSLKETKEPFSFIQATESHTWNLTIHKNQLLIGNHDGAFQVQDNGVFPINTFQNGGWQFVNVPGREDLLLQGSYNGIFVLKKNGHYWTVSHKLVGFDETTREMVIDPKGNLWVGHGYKGIYKLVLSSDYQEIEKVTRYDESKGLPDRNWNSLFLVRNKLLIGTQRGVYEYKEETDEMVPHTHYQSLLGTDQLIRRLVETPNGNVLFIKGLDNEDEIGLVKEGPSDAHEIQRIPFQKLKGELIPAFESVTFYDDQIFFGAKDGLIIYNPGSPKNEVFYTNIRRVFCSNAGDSIIYGHPLEFDASDFGENFYQRLPFHLNAIKITYSASFFERSERTLFRSYLEGFEEEWTGWTSSPNREFTNLKEGNYTFYVESQNVYGRIGEMDTFHFEVLPPWYRTATMKVLYMILFILLCIGLWFFVRYRLRINKLKHLHEIRMQRGELVRKQQQTEQQMTQLQMEKLRSEVAFKSRELASSTLHNAHQNESILKVLRRVEAIETVKDPKALNQLAEVVKLLNDMIDEELTWDQFEQHFNELHDDFIKRIKQKFPKLTSRDIRLCAYLRMNLASKEIAPLMGISYRGVEALRYRIRKKFNLHNTDNLMDFILEF